MIPPNKSIRSFVLQGQFDWVPSPRPATWQKGPSFRPAYGRRSRVAFYYNRLHQAILDLSSLPYFQRLVVLRDRAVPASQSFPSIRILPSVSEACSCLATSSHSVAISRMDFLLFDLPCLIALLSPAEGLTVHCAVGQKRLYDTRSIFFSDNCDSSYWELNLLPAQNDLHRKLMPCWCTF